MDDMPIDYPQDGENYTNGVYYPEVDKQREEQESRDKAVLTVSYPVLGDIYRWFETEVAATDSINAARIYATAHGLDLNDTVRAFDILREILTAKQHEFSQFKPEEDA